MSDITDQLSRRAFVRGGSLFLLGAAATELLAVEQARPKIRVGIVTDLHHADKPPNGSRHYRDTLTKLAEAAKQFTEDKPDFVVELGDFIDAANSVEAEQGYLQQVSNVFNTIPGPKHYVLGNHCVDMLTKDEFLAGVGKKDSFYSFDAGGFHFVVLDACFRSDGRPYGRKNSQWTDANIPPHELDWLQADLKATDKKVFAFAHQRLDDRKHHAEGMPLMCGRFWIHRAKSWLFTKATVTRTPSRRFPVFITAHWSQWSKVLGQITMATRRWTF